jgi:RNA polymerase sigma factor (sigma-70 family)
MTYNYSDFFEHIPDVKNYIRSIIKTDDYKDVLQDTLLYLFIKFDTLIITNLKGLLFNTARFYINKHLNRTKIRFDDIDLCYNVSNTDRHIFKIDHWNANEIDDQLLRNLKSIKKDLYQPFDMQVNGKTVKEISQKLNINENTVKTRIKRAKEYLKDNGKRL